MELDVDVNQAEGVFRRLYDRHHQAVLAYLLRRLDREAAFDAAEDVFLVAWRRLAEVPSGDEALPWLYGVAHNVLLNSNRSAFRLGRLKRRLALNPPLRDRGPEAEAIEHVEIDTMLAAMAKLSERDQEVLRLTYWEELPHVAIGKALGCSTEAVHVRRYRAEKRLANALARAGHISSGRPVVLPKGREEEC